jgi:hypothetical protein
MCNATENLSIEDKLSTDDFTLEINVRIVGSQTQTPSKNAILQHDRPDRKEVARKAFEMSPPFKMNGRGFDAAKSPQRFQMNIDVSDEFKMKNMEIRSKQENYFTTRKTGVNISIHG